MSKLIIIRGSSGAGKSTVTEELMRVLQRPTVHIDQDVYGFIFTNDEVASPVRREMILSNETIIPKKSKLAETIVTIRQVAGI